MSFGDFSRWPLPHSDPIPNLTSLVLRQNLGVESARPRFSSEGGLMRSRWPPINTRAFTVILLVGLPVLAIGTAVVLGIGRARLKEAQGARLAQMAEYIAGTVDAYVFRSILDAAVLARVPNIRQAAAEGNDRPFDERAAMELDRRWQSDRAGVAERSALLESAASRFLADLTPTIP